MDLHLARVLGKQLETSYWLDGIVFDGVVSFPHLTIHNLPTVGPYHIIILLLRTPNSTSPRHNKSIMYLFYLAFLCCTLGFISFVLLVLTTTGVRRRRFGHFTVNVFGL
jgi:hypothetical protein